MGQIARYEALTVPMGTNRRRGLREPEAEMLPLGALVKTTTKIGAALAVAMLISSAQTAEAADAWDVQGLHLEIGVYAGIMLPSADHELYKTSLNQWEELDDLGPVFGGRIGLFLTSWLGVEAEGDYSLLKTKTTDQDANVWRAGGHLVLQLPGRFTPFLVAGGGAIGTGSEQLGSNTDPEFHWGLGVKFYFTQNFGIRIDGRHILTGKYVAAGDDPASWFEVNGGLTFAFGRFSGISDRDDDGVADAVDKCPDKAGIKTDGCPDSDGDGVSDLADKCPDVAAKTADGCLPDDDADGVPNKDDLCPNVAGTAELNGCADTDGDGVTDDKDECKDVAGTLPNGCVDPDPDKDGVLGEADICPTTAGIPPRGCPAEDADGDGIPDSRDKCDNVPGVEPDGCPPDTDGDGVPDNVDKCKDKPETINGYQDKDGCPDEVPAEVKAFTGSIKGITFRSGSSRINRSSYPTLNSAVELLKKYPDTKIRIEGHTDSRGSRRGNQRISQKRADSVRDYLLENGITADRMESVGYGESKPIASNRTRKGRAKNRRIEFTLIN